MESKTRDLTIVPYYGRKITINYADGQTIKEAKQIIKSELEKSGSDEVVDFCLIYGGKRLLNESENLAGFLKEGNNTLYTMASEVHAGCTPKCKTSED